MESLLRLSGLLSEDDDGRTDLGTLEKRLADKSAKATTDRTPSRASETSARPDTSGSQDDSSANQPPSNEHSEITSPEPQKPVRTEKSDKSEKGDKSEEVEALSDMMCSLVTNNCGETRYIGVFVAIQGLKKG